MGLNEQHPFDNSSWSFSYFKLTMSYCFLVTDNESMRSILVSVCVLLTIVLTVLVVVLVLKIRREYGSSIYNCTNRAKYIRIPLTCLSGSACIISLYSGVQLCELAGVKHN